MDQDSDASPIEVHHDGQQQRFYTVIDDRESRLDYDRKNGTLDLQHTMVAESDRGSGVGERLVEAALSFAGDEHLDVVPTTTYLITLILMAVGSVGVIRAVIQGRDIQCGCMGTLFELPMSTVTIIEDVGMGLMAAIMLVTG